MFAVDYVCGIVKQSTGDRATSARSTEGEFLLPCSLPARPVSESAVRGGDHEAVPGNLDTCREEILGFEMAGLV